MRQRNILLVEDTPDEVMLTVTALQQNTTRDGLVVVKDGDEALDYLHCQGGYASREPINPQLILLDLKLPRVDGFDVLQRIRTHPLTKWIPVVILTTSCEQRDVQRCYELGANSFVQKPIDFSDFVAMVDQISVYWLMLNRTVSD